MAEGHRSRLSKAIASLSLSATSEEAAEVLEPILNSFVAKDTAPADENENKTSCDDGVTPLMVACDKANLAALEFIRGAIQANASLMVLTGGPLDNASAQAGGNTAGHHAASCGFAGGIEFLSSLLPERASKQRNLLRVLSRPNANGDTPIMMAAASGHESLLSCWINRLNESGDVSSSEVRTLFEMRNDCGDSACSLASGHGFHPIVALLIKPLSDGEEGTIEASHNDLEKCRSALARMKSLMPAVRRKGNEKEEKYFDDRRGDVQRCIEILEPACERMAQKKMSELLDGESKNLPRGEIRTKKGGRKRNVKKNRRREEKIAASSSSTDVTGARGTCDRPETSTLSQTRSQTNGAWKVDGNHFHGESSDSPRVVTLQDGSVISTSERTSHVAPEEDEAPRSSGKPRAAELTKIPGAPRKSIDNLLRERSASVADGRGAHAEVEAIMDSLCLDPSMLLLTSHGMALNLSPCQLDAIESILNTQLSSIQEAKKIQARTREGD